MHPADGVAHLGLLKHILNLSAQFIWSPLVVSIEERQEFSLRCCNPRVPGRAGTSIILINVPHICKRLSNFGRSIDSAVEDHNYFEGMVVLGKDTIKGLFKKTFAIVDRNNDTY
jgi:hypothetical protein